MQAFGALSGLSAFMHILLAPIVNFLAQNIWRLAPGNEVEASVAPLHDHFAAGRSTIKVHHVVAPFACSMASPA